MRIFLCSILLALTACSSGFQRNEAKRCDDYVPDCVVGARQECSYNSDGCKSCNCVFNSGLPGGH